MRTRSRRGLGWPAAGALAVALGAPTFAQAQQSGLFPTATIRRERVPCAAEDPVYKMYRHEFFGYHPTCWRKFPNGWGCPNPEAPNAAESFRALPRDKPQPDGPPDAGDDTGDAAPGDMPGAAGARPNPNALPPLPNNERSPFDLDTKPNAADPKPAADPRAGVRPSAGTGPAAAVRPPASETLGSLPPPAESVGEAPTAGRDLSPPAPSAPAEGPSASSTADPAATPAEPLLALPDPTVGPSSTASAIPVPSPRTSAPFQAPRRTSVIGGLFSGRLFRR